MTGFVIGAALGKIMQHKGMSVNDVAQEVPVDTRTIRRYKAGENIKPDVIVRLAEVLEAPQLLDVYCHQCEVKQKKERLRLQSGGPKNAA